LHAAFEKLLEAAAHYIWVFPIVCGAGCVARQRTDKSSVLYRGDIVWGRTSAEASRPLLLIKTREGAGSYEPIAEKVILRLGTVDPVNGVGTAEIRHLFDPSNKVFVCRWRSLNCGRIVVENGLLHIAMVLLRYLTISGYGYGVEVKETDLRLDATVYRSARLGNCDA
jgi:hypothetical protein